MTKLKLGPLADDRPVKLTVDLPAAVHRDLAAYAAALAGETGGEPVCPACGCVACYEFRTRRLFKCKGCDKQFSVTSGTTFHGRKLPMRDYLMAIAIFANAHKGISALQLGRDLDVSYKTAFVLAHKLREAMAADQAKYQPRGEVEIDGCHIGGSIRQASARRAASPAGTGARTARPLRPTAIC